MRIRSSLRSVGLVDSGACGEHTDQLRDLHAERIDNVSAFERRLAGHDHPPITATTIPPEAVIEWGRVGGDRRDADEGASSYSGVQERDS